MSLRLGRKGNAMSEKGLPPLPASMAMGYRSENEGRKGEEKEHESIHTSVTESPRRRPSPFITTTGLDTPRFHRDSPTALTSSPTSYRSPRLTSASTSNLFERTSSPASSHSVRHPIDHRPPFAPASPSTASHHSLAPSSAATAITTPRSKRFMFNSSTNTKSSSKSAPSVKSSHTMPDMIAYNDVDQWGVGVSSGLSSSRPPASPRKGSGLNTSPDGGLRRKNSSSKMLAKGAKGLTRSLTRMGSVMKRSTSDAEIGGKGGLAGAQKAWPSKAREKRQSTVQEDMGEEGWERVDIQKEVTEGDTSITRPFNVEHNLHVSPDLDNLPPAWLEALKAQGLSEEDLLLIATARQKAGQRPLIRIVKGSLPPGNHEANDPTTPTTFSQARSRGLSTPAHLMLGHNPPQPQAEPDRPVLNKRFSWERSPTTPTASSSSAIQPPSPCTPLTAFRKSLQPPRSPVRFSPSWNKHHDQDDILELDDTDPELETEIESEATPKKNKRWSDQLRGFQTSFSAIGGDDDWGSSLTSVLNANFGLQTVQEGEERRQSGSMDSARSEIRNIAQEPALPLPDVDTRPPHLDNMKELTIEPIPFRPASHKVLSPTSPTSPSTPRGNRDSRGRRKPVPSLCQPLASPRARQSSIQSAGTSASQSGPTSPHSPTSFRQSGLEGQASQSATPPLSGSASAPSPERVEKVIEVNHIRCQSVAQSSGSELDHELRTPLTNDNFLLSPTSSDGLPHPPLLGSTSNDSQWVTGSSTVVPLLPNAHEGEITNAKSDANTWSGYVFPRDSPPRPDPRYSLPATVGYTESSPPSRSPTPAFSDTAEYSDDEHDRYRARDQVSPGPASPRPLSHSHTYPQPLPTAQSPKLTTRPVSKSSSSSSRRLDPLSRLDQAGTMSERASIALSMISSSNVSDARSSLNSFRDSYMHEAKVLKAYMRDPAELGGLRESDGEGASEQGSGSGSNSHENEEARHGSSSAYKGEVFDVYHQDEGVGSRSKSSTSPRSSHSARVRKSTSTSTSPTSHRSQRSSTGSHLRRIKQEAEPVESQRQRPFAYQPLEADREQDAIYALDDAARQIASLAGGEVGQ